MDLKYKYTCVYSVCILPNKSRLRGIDTVPIWGNAFCHDAGVSPSEFCKRKTQAFSRSEIGRIVARFNALDVNRFVYFIDKESAQKTLDMRREADVQLILPICQRGWGL